MCSVIDGACGVFDSGSVNDNSLNSGDSTSSNPFVAYDDGYEWPDLYSEVDEMMEFCILIYPLADLRRLARAGKLRLNAREALRLPLAATELVNEVSRNKSVVLASKLCTQWSEEAIRALLYRHFKAKARILNSKITKKRYYEDDISSSDEEEFNYSHRSHISTNMIMACEDRLQQEEMVFAIGVNHNRKRVSICFRGAVARTDWATDFDIYMKDLPNPIRMHGSQPPFLKVHSRFYEYLFDRSHKGTEGPNGEPLSEYEEILQDHVIPTLRTYPGYKLYVTGHSLGAALSTLFAFEAASEPDAIIPKPVTCISFGSPYVGDDSFRSAHQLLEGLGKLRHIRVSNHKDLITTIPKMSFRWVYSHEENHIGSLFKHVGMNLRLYSGGSDFEISFPKRDVNLLTAFFDEVTRGWDQSPWSNFSWNPSDYVTWPWHSIREYNTRMAENEHLLRSLFLNDLYERQDIVGYLTPQYS